MYCDNCGNQLRDGAKFCHKCGASVSELENYQNNASQNQAQPVQQAQSVNQTTRQQVVYQPVYQPQTRPYYAPGTHPYHRLGGFLMFIVVSSYISGVGTFISIVSTIVSYASLLSMSKWFPGGFTACLVFAMIGAIILDIITGAVIISYANQIRRKESGFLHFIQSASITIMIIGSAYYLIVILWMKSFDRYGAVSSGSIIGTLIAMAVAWVLGLIFGCVYFGCSVRVRTYMGSDSYLKQSIFNKNSHPIPADGSDQPGVVSNDKAISFNPEKQWYCTQCGRINENYTTTCLCGMLKPTGDLSKSWICKNCGNYNMGNLYECTKCGSKKFQEPVYSDWICPKCGGRNSHSNGTCSVCYTPNPNKSERQAQRFAGSNEWQCPKCGKVNANYVGTCGCGQTKP